MARQRTHRPLGIDPIVALADNSDIPRERIPEVLGCTARGLVEAALGEVAGRRVP